MKSLPFESALGTYLQNFVDEKRALGFKYEAEEYVLHSFDRYWSSSAGDSISVSMDSLRDWVSQRSTEGKRSQYMRVCVLKQFMMYMNGIGIPCYVPSDRIHYEKSIVHVLSKEEISELFRVIDNYCPPRQSPDVTRMSVEYKVIFRLILSVGLRRTETACIRVQDVDWNKGVIGIFNGKKQKDRLVYLSSDMLQLLTEYRDYMHGRYGDSYEWLFPSIKVSDHISSGGLGERFRKFWAMTSCSSTCGKAPTIHALRHTFVVMRMNEWMLDGSDLNVMMPYLSRHLGHKSSDETFYYYHQVADAFSVIHEKDTLAPKVIPEVRIR